MVGSSITFEGSVCKHCNEREWGEALIKRRGYKDLGAALLRDAAAADAPKPPTKENP